MNNISIDFPLVGADNSPMINAAEMLLAIDKLISLARKDERRRCLKVAKAIRRQQPKGNAKAAARKIEHEIRSLEREYQ